MKKRVRVAKLNGQVLKKGLNTSFVSLYESVHYCFNGVIALIALISSHELFLTQKCLDKHLLDSLLIGK